MTDEKIVFVTGGTGFIGRHAVHALLRSGYEVHVASRSYTGPFAPSPRMRIHECDLFDSDYVCRMLQMIQPTHLMHLAWETTHGRFWNAPSNAQWIEASLGLLRGFSACGGQRAVFAGSCAEYGESAEICDEVTTPLRPTSLYGVSKNALQQVVAEYSRTTGLSSAWGRLFNVYGPGESEQRFVSSTVKTLLSDKSAICRHGSHVRDYLHVHDAGDALTTLLESDVTGPVNVASGRPVTLEEIATRLVATVGRGNATIENGEPSIDNPPELSAVTERLSKEVAWAPSITLDEGLRSVVHTLQQHRQSRAA